MKKKILFLVIFFLFQNNSFAQKFLDDKSYCEAQNGNWRKFANSCADSCEYKFDPFLMCMQSLQYACDCGESRCWSDNKCILKSEYKIIFDKKSKEKEEELQKVKKEREEKIKNDPAYSNYIYNLYPRPNQNQVNNNAAKEDSALTPIYGGPVENKNIQKNVKNEQAPIEEPVKPVLVPIAPPKNSSGDDQDLVFPVVPLPTAN